MPRTAIVLTLVTLGVLAAPAAALAANPTGTGQPDQSCEAQPSAPAGFATAGFANAEAHYAGSGPGSAHAASAHAVSQYDVACFQVSQH